jgi:predicted NBD/HSP70 family sugar kinase
MYLLFDIGGTKMRVALSFDGETIGEINKFSTPEDFDGVLYLLTDYKKNSYNAVAVGLAGILDKEKSKILHSPNLRGWENYPIVDKLSEFFNTKTYLENDAALAGLGEATFGAGKDKEIVAYLTISTGVGGARIVGKKVDTSLWGFEPGKHIVDADMSIWSEIGEFDLVNIPPGSIESYISGAALKHRFGKPSYEIDDYKVWDKVEKLLAVAIHNTLSYWSPEIVVLGGGIILNDAVSIEKIYQHLGEISNIFPYVPEVKKAELGDDTALYGALSLVKDK